MARRRHQHYQEAEERRYLALPRESRAAYFQAKLEKAGLIADEILARMIYAEVEHATRLGARQIGQAIERAACLAKLANNKFVPAPTAQDLTGEVPIGFVDDGRNDGNGELFHLSHKAINRGVILTGQHGTGKTTCARHIISGIGEDIGFLIFDPKDDHERCAGAARFTWPEWRWAPLERFSWLPLDYQITIFVELFIEAFDLMEASRAFLTRILKEMYARYPDGRFTLRDFQDVLAKVRPRSSREGQTKEACLSKLEGLLASCKDVFECTKGIQPGDLFHGRVSLSQFGLQSSACYFLSNSILAMVMAWSRMQEPRGDQLRLVVVAEEARITLFDRNRERRFNVSTPQSAVVASTSREFGIGLVIIDNVFNGLSEAARTNCNTLLTLRQGGDNVRAVARTMNLNGDQKEELMSLQVGQAIVRTPAWPRPFKIRVPEDGNELLR